MDIKRLFGNCGICEISGIHGASIDQFLVKYNSYRQGGDRSFGPLFPIVVFSDANCYGDGKRLAEELKKKKIGPVEISKTRTNDNTANRICFWTWYPSETFRNKLKVDGYIVDGKQLTYRQASAQAAKIRAERDERLYGRPWW